MTTKAKQALIAASKRSNKYKAIKTERNGIRFDSKLEADVYDWLQKGIPECQIFRQVSLRFGGNKLVVDFMTVFTWCTDGEGHNMQLWDAKGKPLADWIAKVNHLYDTKGLIVCPVSRADLKREPIEVWESHFKNVIGG